MHRRSVWGFALIGIIAMAAGCGGGGGVTNFGTPQEMAMQPSATAEDNVPMPATFEADAPPPPPTVADQDVSDFPPPPPFDEVEFWSLLSADELPPPPPTFD